MSKLAKKFESLIDKIKEAATDFTTLEVTTITGEISHVVNNEGEFESKELLKQISNKGQTTQNFNIIAHTHIDFDHDTVNFIKDNLSNSEKKLFEFHNQAIENAKKSRQEMLRFIGEIVAPNQ